MIAHYLVPSLVGILTGALYGLSFIFQHRAILLSHHPQLNRLQQIALFALRIMIVVYSWHYLLRLDRAASILGLLLFIGMFWMVILLVKARVYERI